jgi:endonuclease/exonuclease/phosphatase family metal-dependent hydrolase
MTPRRSRRGLPPRGPRLPPFRIPLPGRRSFLLALTLWVTYRLGLRRRSWLVLAALAVLLIVLGLWLLERRGPVWPRAAKGSRSYLFCTWNVENLFDDDDDPTNHDPDEDWFGRHPDLVREKVDRLARALRLQNGGRGPDVLAVVELESRRAAALLRDALNAGLARADRYTTLVHRDNRSGRRVGPAILARLPARDDLTRSFAPDRTLEAHLVGPGGAALVVLVSHWTSRVRGGTADHRAAYADTVYRAVADLIASDPAADVLVAGDFNDEPGDRSVVAHLHAVADPGRVLDASRHGGRPLLLDLTARLDTRRGEGTYYYGGRWQVFDHLVASPGLLDSAGWRVLPETLRIENPRALRYGRDGRPWRFGGPDSVTPRGYSDHFAVTVRLTVQPVAGTP